MRDPQQDHDLRELFQELKATDERSAPDFGRMMARAKEDAAQSPQDEAVRIYSVPLADEDQKLQGIRESMVSWVRLHTRWALTGGGILAAAAVAAILLSRPPVATETEFERAVRSFTTNPALGAWESPTEGLLNVPGIELLRTVPDIGNPRLPGSSREPLT